MGKLIRGVTDLATVRPDLVADWHPTANGDLKPTDVTAGSNKVVWWLCSYGHECSTSVYNKVAGGGCPICSNRQVLSGFNDLATTHPELAQEWHPTLNGDLTPSKIVAGSGRSVWWQCKLGHEWRANGNTRVKQIGCPFCAGNRAWAGFNDMATTNPDLASEWHPSLNGNLTASDVIAGTAKKIWWLGRCGHEWQISGNGRMSGTGCPVCNGKVVLEGFNDLASQNPDLAAEWNLAKNLDLKAHQITSVSNRRVWWLCEFGHEWLSTVAHRVSGKGCPRCAKTGYDQTSPGYLYLLRKEHLDLQQFGISNKPDDRLVKHQRNGWELLDILGPADGVWIVETETALGRFFQDKGVLLPRDYPDKFDGYSESWHSDELSFSRCADMLQALRDWETKI